MEVKVKLRLPDSKAYQTLSTILSPFHKQTHFQNNVFFDGAASELSSRRAFLRLCFYGEDCETAKRCVVSLKVNALLVDGVDRVEEEDEEIDLYWARQVWANPNLIGSVESRIFKRVREEFAIKLEENGNDGGRYICLGGFKNVKGVYEWNGLNLELDEALYDFGTLYEVECKSAEPDKAKELIEQQLKQTGIPYSYSAMSKFEIFRSGKLPKALNSTGTDAICMISPNSANNKPLWQYVTKLQKCEGGGNISFRCNICQGIYKGSYSRVKAHLLKISGHGIKHCSKVTAEHLNDMKRLVGGTELRMKKAVPLDYRLPSPPPASSESSSEKKAIMSSTSPEKMMFAFKKRKITGDSGQELDDVPSKEHLDREIARMFFSAGLPFSIADNQFFKNAFSFAAKTNFTDYVPPNCSYLGNNLLKREWADLEKWIEPVKNSREHKGVTIVCGGWTYPKQSCVNIMAVIGVPIFLKAVNCARGKNDKILISNLIKEVIMEIGPSNVVQVITENAPDCREAGMLIEKAYPHVFWTPCVAHTLDLALRKICYPLNTGGNAFAYRECSWIMEVVDSVRMVKNFIMNCISSLSIVVDNLDLKVLGLNETRNGYDVVLMRRFVSMKDELQLMVINEKWSLLDEDHRENARLVKKKLLNDIFWGKIQYILSFTEPIYDMMKVVNSGRRCLHLMHEMWGSMMMKVKETIYYHELKEANEDSMLWNVLNQILQEAWRRSKNPIYALAHSLNPRYSCKQWLSEDITRRPPHKDPEISSMRNACLERYFPNEEDRRWVNLELAKFFESEGKFSETDSFQQRSKLDALTWWTNYGAATPSLQTLALKLLSQPCSSWCSDPNWGPKSFEHKVKDQIDPQRDEELLYVHMNLKSRTLQQMQCESPAWENIYGNSFDSDSSACT